MKKNIPLRMVTLLALTFSTYAAAQSQVTLYGIIDTNVEILNNMPKEGGAKANLVRMHNSGLQGPRVGFRGSEDLGGGLKAIFTLEHGFNSDTGTQADASRFFNRGSFVGLESKQHRVTLGRQYTSIFDALVLITPLAYSGAYEPFSPLLGNLRNDNSVKYRFNANGVSAQLHYAFGEQAASKSANAAWGGFVTYANSGLNATVVVDQQNGADVNGAHARSRKLATAMSYQLNTALRLSAGYRWGENKTDTGTIALRDDFWWLGANYQVSGPLSLNVAYYQDNVKKRNGVGDQPTTRQLTLQGIYALSKRTDVYAAAAHSRNAGLNFAALSTLAAGAKNQTGMSVGVRHRF